MKILRDKYSKEPAWAILQGRAVRLADVMSVGPVAEQQYNGGPRPTFWIVASGNDTNFAFASTDEATKAHDEFLRAVLEAQGVELE